MRVVSLVGLPGSGKSYALDILAKAHGQEVYCGNMSYSALSQLILDGMDKTDGFNFICIDEVSVSAMNSIADIAEKAGEAAKNTIIYCVLSKVT